MEIRPQKTPLPAPATLPDQILLLAGKTAQMRLNLIRLKRERYTQSRKASQDQAILGSRIDEVRTLAKDSEAALLKLAKPLAKLDQVHPNVVIRDIFKRIAEEGKLVAAKSQSCGQQILRLARYAEKLSTTWKPLKRQ